MEKSKALINQSATRDSSEDAVWRRIIHAAHRLELSYYIVAFFQILARKLPRSVGYFIGQTLALGMYVSWPGMRRTVTENVRRVLGPDSSEEEVRRVVRLAFRNYLKYLTEFLRFPGAPASELKPLVEGSGWEHLNAALEAGKGAVIAVFHLGNWDLAASMIALEGFKISAVVDRFESPKLNALVETQRERGGVGIIHLGQAARGVIQALRRNEVIGLMVDIPSFSTGVPIQLFGGTSYLPTGAASLALRTGATVLPGYLIRKPDNNFKGAIGAPVAFTPTGDAAKDAQCFTQLIADRLCEFVREHPEQWFLCRTLWADESTCSSSGA